MIAPGETFYEKNATYLVGKVADIKGIGRVWDYHPYSYELAHIIDLYAYAEEETGDDTEQRPIRAFTIDREMAPSQGSAGNVSQWTHTFVMRYFWSVDIERGSKRKFQVMVDQILDVFKDEIFMGNDGDFNAMDSAPITVPVISETDFLGVMCHYAEFRINVIDHNG